MVCVSGASGAALLNRQDSRLNSGCDSKISKDNQSPEDSKIPLTGFPMSGSANWISGWRSPRAGRLQFGKVGGENPRSRARNASNADYA